MQTGSRSLRICLEIVAMIVENEDTDGRREVASSARPVEHADKLR
jgi:hypothetical protein